MAIVIEIPTGAPDPQVTHVNLYKKPAGQTIYNLLAQITLGTATYTDPFGQNGDSFYSRFYDNISGVEGPPGPVVVISDHTHVDPLFGVILEVPVTTLDSRITHVNIYRRRKTEQFFSLITTLDLGVASYKDVAGKIGDSYYSTFLDNSRGLESQPSPILVVTEIVSPEIMVSGICVTPSGTGIANLEISAELVHPSVSHLSFNISAIVERVETATTNSSGSWTLSLMPNDKIYPTGSFYMFRFFSGNSYKEIRANEGLAQDFNNLRTVKPLILR